MELFLSFALRLVSPILNQNLKAANLYKKNKKVSENRVVWILITFIVFPFKVNAITYVYSISLLKRFPEMSQFFLYDMPYQKWVFWIAKCFRRSHDKIEIFKIFFITYLIGLINLYAGFRPSITLLSRPLCSVNEFFSLIVPILRNIFFISIDMCNKFFCGKMSCQVKIRLNSKAFFNFKFLNFNSQKTLNTLIKHGI